MITRANLSDLISFAPEEYLTTTLYLHVDGSAQPVHSIELKDLIKHRKRELEDQNLRHAVLDSVNTDFRRIREFVDLEFSREGVRTLVIFACSAKNLWKVLTLSHALGTHLVIQPKPYLRPLSFMLDEFQRFLVILVERSRARFFSVHAGEVVEHSNITDDVPRKVREGGYAGYEERRIERHIEDHVRRHFKHTADIAYDLSKRVDTDSVILAGSEQNTNEFQHYLHKTLSDRLVSQIQLDILVTQKDVLAAVGSVEKELRAREEKKLLDRFFDQVKSGGLGIVGLNGTIRALQQGQVNYVLVQEGYRAKGYRCAQCRSLHANNGACDFCGGQTQEVPDVVDEVLLDAMGQGCHVKYITLSGSELSTAGNIGAMLRFKV